MGEKSLCNYKTGDIFYGTISHQGTDTKLDKFLAKTDKIYALLI